MACVRKRRGKRVADWRDGAGRRVRKTCDTRRDAEDFLDAERPKSRQWQRSSLPLSTTIETYVVHWLKLIRPTVKRRTVVC